MTIIIRASGERTEQACKIIAERQSGARIEVVRGRPFWRTLKLSMEAGLDVGSKWTLILDADVLLAQNAIHAMINEMDEADDTEFYMYNFMVLDRGFSGPTHAGTHGYRTALLKQAMKFVEAAKDEIRPETYICDQMAECGFPFIQSQSVVGLHDYEQYYRDLYRKNYVRSYKFRGLSRYVLDRCRQQYRDDDYKVILWGFLDGLRESVEKSEAALDALAYLSQSEEVMEILGVREKEGLEVDDNVSKMPGDILENYKPDDLYKQNMASISPRPYKIISSDSL